MWQRIKPNLMEKVEVMTIMDIIFHPKVFIPDTLRYGIISNRKHLTANGFTFP